ncbi:MAG: L-type lectin-domain containing protein, partial [Candidatus Sulfotelmatobacter sp.]
PLGVTTVLRLTPNATFTAGSAWYNTPQPVSGAFSTTFTFQLSGGNTGDSPADGFAFVIQNSGTNALGPDGCGIGFGDSASGCTPSTGGIPNSLAIEFNTYNNGFGVDPSNNDVTIQNCGLTGANSVDQSCSVAVNDLTQLSNPINMADGNVHTVTITYAPSTLSNCGPEEMPTCSTIDVILDGIDLFPSTGANPNPVLFNLASIGLASSNSCSDCLAWVGFTAATGGGDDNQDILSWTFTPQAESAAVSTTTAAVLPFPNASGATAYSYTALLTQSYPTPVIQVQPILMTQRACDALVQVNFPTARCFVYQNAENTGLDESVVFAVTCPDSPGGTCGSVTDQNFFAQLGTGFSFLYSDNPLFVYPGLDLVINPFPGWIKWPLPPSPTPVSPIGPPAKGSMSNQIASFSVVSDPGGKTVGGSGGGASYWVATYLTPGEALPGITISSPKVTTYTQNQTVTANYTCSNPSTSKPITSPTGPYLTVASCTQGTGTQTPGSCVTNPTTGAITCSGTVPTSSKGLQVFEVTAIDSGGNQNLDAVIYDVK